MSIPARLSALTRAQVQTVNGYIIAHACGHVVDYSRFPYWQNPENGQPPAVWTESRCDACEDARADKYPARFSVTAQRCESGEWSGDR